jgi:hypothetical protein
MARLPAQLCRLRNRVATCRHFSDLVEWAYVRLARRPLVVVPSFDLDAISLAERPYRVTPPLGVGSRCVITFTSFSEFNKAEGGDIWLTIDERRPLACIAGIWTNWTPVRKVKERDTTNDVFTFLTTEPNSKVGAIHPRAMPVILTTPAEVETWVTVSSDAALKRQGRFWTERASLLPGVSRKTEPNYRRREHNRGRRSYSPFAPPAEDHSMPSTQRSSSATIRISTAIRSQ